MFTRRIERVGRLIQIELANILCRQIKDPRLERITLTGVSVSPDLKLAKIFYSLLDQDRKSEIEQGFYSAVPFLRRKLANRLYLKTVPKLVLVYDRSLIQGFFLEKIIRQARRFDKIVSYGKEDDVELKKMDSEN